jgi:hypothetical protein
MALDESGRDRVRGAQAGQASHIELRPADCPPDRVRNAVEELGAAAIGEPVDRAHEARHHLRGHSRTWRRLIHCVATTRCGVAVRLA